MSPLLQSPFSVELALLGFVRHQSCHGYEVYRRLSETPELRMIWRMKQSRLYALLSRLEEDGLLRATLESQDGRPPRKVYHLTTAGENAFDRWLVQPVQLPREMRLEFMLKLYFAQDEPAAVARLIRGQQEVCARWLATQESDNEESATFIRAVRAYRRSHIRAIRDWLAWLAVDWILE